MDSRINSGPVNVGRVIVMQAVAKKALFCLRRIRDNFRRVERAKCEMTAGIEHIIPQIRKRLFGRKVTSAIIEERQDINAGLPPLAHAEECCLGDFGVVEHQSFCSGDL